MPARLSDVFKSHPIHSQHKHMDFTSLKEVPDSYKWTTHDEYSSKDSSVDTVLSDESLSVPVIDLTGTNAMELIGNACKTWGVFQIINHDVPITLLDNIESMSKTLFSLPVQQKLKAARTPEGVTGYGFARIASFFSKLFWSEGFTVVGSPLEHARKLWPNDPFQTKFCNVIDEYNKEMKKLGTRLVWLALGSLGVGKEDIKWAGLKGDMNGSSAALQLNFYPACPNPDRAMGMAAHTDSTLLTILYQNSTSGLQVHKAGAGWVTVPPIHGALIVNIADLLHILTNGAFTSVPHRAIVNNEKHRLSFAYLFGPPSTAQISPLPKLVGPNQPPMYKSVTWHDYLGTKAKLFNNALASIRICNNSNSPLTHISNVTDLNNSIEVR